VFVVKRDHERDEAGDAGDPEPGADRGHHTAAIEGWNGQEVERFRKKPTQEISIIQGAGLR